MIQSKKLLMQNFVNNVTLTVSTNPVSATCTLTYNGQSYETKSAIVPKGTTINYSIYHATYGTETGSITMDDNKTINFEGTYSVSYTYQRDINITGSLSSSGDYNAIVSGFSTANFATSTVKANYNSASTMEFQVKFKTGTNVTTQATVVGGVTVVDDPFYLNISGSRFYWSTKQASHGNLRNRLSGTLSTSTWYTMRGYWNGSSWTFYKNGSIVTVDQNATNEKLNENDYLGFGREYAATGNRHGFTGGTIDFNETWLKLDGEYVWRGVKAIPSYTYYWEKTTT